MSPAKMSSSCCPSIRPARALLATACILAATVAGCAAPAIPEDVQETFNHGLAAEHKDDREARIHYSRVLDRYPNLVRALLARGHCYLRMAEQGGAEERRDHLQSALKDFQKAAQVETNTDPKTRVSALTNEGLCFIALGRDDEARKTLHELLGETGLEEADRALTHERLGALELRALHREIAVDRIIATRETELLAQVRAARHHFGNALEIGPRSANALKGKGICLLHEDLLEDAESHLVETLAAQPAEDATPDIHYLLALVRERRLGPNDESNEGYLEALEQDALRTYDPVYTRLYQLFGDQNRALPPPRRYEIVRRLLEYEGDDTAVWREAKAYFDARVAGPAPAPVDRLGHAVAHARLGDPEIARDSFEAWVESRGASSVDDRVQAIELTFHSGRSVDRDIVNSYLTLEHARAYSLLFKDDLVARAPARAQLEGLLNQLGAATDDPEEQELYAEASALLSEELIELAASLPEDSPERGNYLNDAERYSVAEQRLRPAGGGGARFRLARLELMRPQKFPYDAALRVAEQDPDHRYLPAYELIVAALPKIVAQKLAIPPDVERASYLERVENAIIEYAGASSEIITVKRAIETRRREEEIEKALRETPCPDCGLRAKKTDAVCPRCGTSLPD